jgi:hypothetical protein
MYSILFQNIFEGNIQNQKKDASCVKTCSVSCFRTSLKEIIQNRIGLKVFTDKLTSASNVNIGFVVKHVFMFLFQNIFERNHSESNRLGSLHRQTDKCF